MDMVNAWRLLNPDSRRYTWRKLAINGIKQSRLDYIIMPKSFLYNVDTIDIEDSIYSDHNPIHLKLKPTISNRKGRGFWKFNVALLKDKDYVMTVNKMIDQEIAENKGSNKGFIWDTIKMKLHGLTISYSSIKRNRHDYSKRKYTKD
jgi:hypothetical protein